MLVSALILAGGKATRLGGIDKRELVIEGQTIFARQCAVLAPRVAEIIVSSGRDVSGFRTVRDAIADVGPLAGIAAGLAVATTPWLLVIAGDMPYISAALVELLIAAAVEPPEPYDAIGIRIGGIPEPLVCVLRVVPARVAVTARLAAGRHKASGLLGDGDLRVAWIDEAALRAIDPDLRALRNVNGPDDLQSG